MIRATVPDDTPILKEFTAATGFFRPHEVGTLQEVLDDYHHQAHAKEGHLCYTLENKGDGQLQGFVYFAPEAMTVNTWALWWIVVRPGVQAKGLGGRMLKFAEDEIRRRGGRLLFIETSSQPLYDPTRRFYIKYHYEEHAVLKDYYAPGDSLVIFRKEL